jgi:hypothetical protein
VQLGMQANTAYAGSKGAFLNWYGVGHVTRYLCADHICVMYDELESTDNISGNLCA